MTANISDEIYHDPEKTKVFLEEGYLATYREVFLKQLNFLNIFPNTKFPSLANRSCLGMVIKTLATTMPMFDETLQAKAVLAIIEFYSKYDQEFDTESIELFKKVPVLARRIVVGSEAISAFRKNQILDKLLKGG